jgi:hypothetical protein
VTVVPENRPHLIHRRDVADWLADSIVRDVTLHRTSEQAAADILENGVELAASRIASFGQGFYTSSSPDPLLGPAEVAVAIRTRRPLVGTLDEVAAVIDDIARLVSPRDPRITPAVAAEIRRHLLELGYDGIVVWDGGGDGVDYVVAIVGGSARVVID